MPSDRRTNSASAERAIAADLPAIPGYSVGERLGAGGFGEVFAGRHTKMGRDVAIKILHAKYSSDAESVARFVVEARAVGKLSHPNIVDVFDLGELPDGRQFYVMERIRGKTLRDVLRERSKLPLDEAVPILRGIAEAVDAAHAAGIAHRDLKPDNVFVLDGGGVKLIDFGLAKLTRETDVPVTQTGAVFGTPLYMSPEQCRGRSIDESTDAYSLGVVAYHVLTGAPPFHGDALELAMHHIHDEPEPPSKRCGETERLDARVDRVIAALMSKDPAERPRPLAPAIAALVGEASLPPAPRTKRRSRAWLVAPLGIALVVGGLFLARDKRSAAAAPSCISGAARFDPMWNPWRKAQLVARFDASPKAFVRDFGRVAFDATDKIVDDLRLAQDAYCRERDSVNAVLHAQRANCIDERARKLENDLASWFTRPVDELALQVSDRTLRARECMDDNFVRVQLLPLADPAARATEDEALSKAERLLEQHGYDTAIRDDKKLDEIEQQLGEPLRTLEQLKAPSITYVKLLRATFVRSKRRDYERGNRLLDEVIAEAERSRDEHLLADALHTRIDSHLDEVRNAARTTYDAALVTGLIERMSLAVERGGKHPHNIAKLLRARQAHAWQMKKPEEALRLADELVTHAEKHFGVRSAELVAALSQRAEGADRVGDFAGSLERWQRAMRIRATLIGPRHIATLHELWLAALMKDRKLDEAVAMAELRTPVVLEMFGESAPQVLVQLDWLGHTYTMVGRSDDGIRTYRDVIARIEKARLATTPFIAWQYFKLGEALWRRGRPLEAIEPLRKSELLLTQLLGADHSENVRGPRYILIDVLFWIGQYDEARQRLVALDTLLAQDKHDPQLRDQLRVMLSLARQLLRARGGDVRGAERELRAQLAACKQDEGCRQFNTFALGLLAMRDKRPRDAVKHLEWVVESKRAELAPFPAHQMLRVHLHTFTARLAEAHLASGNARRARELFEQAAPYGDGVQDPEADFARARTLVATDGDRERAVEHARRALELFTSAKHADAAREVELWLAKHGP